MKEKKNWKRRLAGPLVSLSALVLLDQAVVRTVLATEAVATPPLPPFAVELSPEQRTWLKEMSEPLETRPNTIFDVDADLGWSNAPHGTAHDGFESTNSRGFRGSHEYAVPKPDGVTRVAVFGDSFTWGADVRDAETYPAQLEQLAPDLEVPNLGVSAYGTDQALLRFRRDGADLEADHVVAGVMLENIGRNVNRYRPLWLPFSTVSCVKPRLVLDGDELEVVPSPFGSIEELVAAVRDGSVVERAALHEHWHTRPALRPLAISPSARLIGAYLAQREREVERLWADPDGEPYRVTRAILRTFRDEAIERGAESFLVLIFPTREALHGLEQDAPRYWQSMVDDLTADGIDVLDATDALRSAQAATRAKGERAPMFTRRHHLRPEYNAVVARAVAARLGLLD